MRDLNEIVKANRDAVSQGVAQPGELVGTTPTRYDVVGDSVNPGAVLETGKTIAELGHWRNALNLGTAKLVPTKA